MKIIPISDTHFHHLDKDNEEVSRRTEALKKFPDHIIVLTGDVTDDGRDDQYDRALKALDYEHRIELPGNHDYGSLGNAYEESKASAFDAAFQWDSGPFFNKIPVTVRIENVLLILLNSNLETTNPFDFACGKIGVRQLGLLNGILIDPANKDLIKMVALHHHPFIHSDPTMQLLDADKFTRTIYGRVDILMFGHKHEEGYWHNKSGCKEILAAGALFESSYVKEVTIEGNIITVKKIQLF